MRATRKPFLVKHGEAEANLPVFVERDQRLPPIVTLEEHDSTVDTIENPPSLAAPGFASPLADECVRLAYQGHAHSFFHSRVGLRDNAAILLSLLVNASNALEILQARGCIGQRGTLGEWLVNELEHVIYVKEETFPSQQAISAEIARCGEQLRGVMRGIARRYLLDEYRRGACGTMPTCALPTYMSKSGRR